MVSYYDGNNIRQSRHSRESGNPALAWMPDRTCPVPDMGSGMTGSGPGSLALSAGSVTVDMFICRSNNIVVYIKFVYEGVNN